MAGITVSHLSFTYPQETVPALRDVSFSVEEGEFLTLIGPSGGGKSTLLRALKPALTPHGSFTGEISFFGEPLSALDARRQAAEIGFVLQKPDEQIVTDRVWHELAFGMESLGFATPVIRRRVAEMASFFGIEEWFSRPVEALSGGQKQLLNLASVMALQPRVLLLDEPTSQLDPIAAADFLNAVARIRRELGTTVILSEHRLEEALPLCDRVLALEQTVLAHGTPQEVSRTLRAADSPVYFSMPTPVRVSGSVGADECPVTVTEGRQWLARYAASHPLADVPPRRLRPAGEELLGLKDVWFRYEKDGEDVLQDLSCSFARGQLTALLGGNGSGKTTTLSLLAGLRRPLRGKRFCRTERIGLLPQDPQMLFDRATVRDELREQLASLPEAEQARRMQEMACFCRLEGLLDRHPYDLSGGEQQRAALAKLPKDAPMDEVAELVKRTAFKITRLGQLVANLASERLGVPAGIIDLSLAPTPAIGDSVANILEEMGLESCGCCGTTACLALLNDAVKKGGVMASNHVGGLSGAFIPVSEDDGMINAANCGSLTLEKLEAMTAVCSVGIDMVVIPGDTSAEVISGLIADEAAIGMVNSKTTAVRVIPAIGHKAGDVLDFGGLLGHAPIMPISRFSPAVMIHRGGRIPAPMQALKN